MTERLRDIPPRKRSHSRLRDGYVRLGVKPVPARLKRRLNEAARDSNMNDVAVALLARRFGVPFIPSGRVSPIEPSARAGSMLLEMPRELRLRIKIEAANRDTTLIGLIIAVLEEELEKEEG